MAIQKYENLSDTDLIYLLVNSTNIYYDIIHDRSTKYINVQYYGSFKAKEWSQRRINMLYRRINDIRRKYKLLSVKTGSTFKECIDGMPPQKLQVI